VTTGGAGLRRRRIITRRNVTAHQREETVKRLATGSAFALMAAAAILLPAEGRAEAAKTWVVGEVAPLTGPVATVGVRLHNVVTMWAEDVNAKGGIKGRKIELISCNDEAKPEKAVACTRDIMDKKAVMILGDTLTASLHAMQALTKNGPTLLIPSPNVVPPADSFAFQVSPSDEHLTLAIAKYLKENGVKKIGMVAATDASGEVGVANGRKVFPKEGIELELARIDLKATDASTQLTRVAGKDVPVVYSNYSGGGAIAVVKSFKNLGLQQPLIVSYANISAAFVNVIKDVRPDRLLGTSVIGLVPDALTDAGERERSKAFFARYQKHYNEHADMINLLGQAEIDVADAILRNVADPTDYAAVKKYLESTPIPSVQDQRFSPTNHVGLDASDVMIVELKGDGWVKAGPVK
jgi:branched-chain amino acid transport system substrate-binding protein